MYGAYPGTANYGSAGVLQQSIVLYHWDILTRLTTPEDEKKYPGTTSHWQQKAYQVTELRLTVPEYQGTKLGTAASERKQCASLT